MTVTVLNAKIQLAVILYPALQRLKQYHQNMVLEPLHHLYFKYRLIQGENRQGVPSSLVQGEEEGRPTEKAAFQPILQVGVRLVIRRRRLPMIKITLRTFGK